MVIVCLKISLSLKSKNPHHHHRSQYINHRFPFAGTRSIQSLIDLVPLRGTKKLHLTVNVAAGRRRQQLRLIPVTLPKNNHMNYVLCCQSMQREMPWTMYLKNIGTARWELIILCINVHCITLHCICCANIHQLSVSFAARLNIFLPMSKLYFYTHTIVLQLSTQTTISRGRGRIKYHICTHNNLLQA